MGLHIGVSAISAFLKFVLTVLSEQGISQQKVVGDFAEQNGLSFGQHRDFVGLLAEHGVTEVQVPEKPEGKLTEPAAETREGAQDAPETPADISPAQEPVPQGDGDASEPAATEPAEPSAQ